MRRPEHTPALDASTLADHADTTPPRFIGGSRLKSRAKAQTTHTKAIITAASTIQETAEAWLPTVKVRAENGTLSWSTYENYETTVRLTLVPVCGWRSNA